MEEVKPDTAVLVADDRFFEALAPRLHQSVNELRRLSHEYVTHLDEQAHSFVTHALISQESFDRFLALETEVFLTPAHANLRRGVKSPETNVPTYFTVDAPDEADENPKTFSPLQLLEKLLSLSEDSPARTQLGVDIHKLFMRHPLCRTTRFKALCNAYEHEVSGTEKTKIQEQMIAYCKSRDALEHYLLGKSRENKKNPNIPNRLGAFNYSNAYREFFETHYKETWNLTKQQVLERLLSDEEEYQEYAALREQLAEEIKDLFSANPNLAEGRDPQEIDTFSRSEGALIWLLRDTTYREQLHFTRACETYEQHVASRVTKNRIISDLLLEEKNEEAQGALREDSHSEEPSLSRATFSQYKEKHPDTLIRVWENTGDNKELTLNEQLSQQGNSDYKQLDVLKTDEAPARYHILTSMPFEPLGSFNDFCLQHTAAATAKINWIRTTLGEKRYQTYLETIRNTHAGLPEIDGVIICSELSQPDAPLSLSVTKVDKHGKAKINSFPMFISPNSGYNRRDTIHLLVHKNQYFIGETPDETLLRLTYPDLRTPAAPRIEGNMDFVGEPIGDPFVYLKKLNRKIAKNTNPKDTSASDARNNLIALMEHMGSACTYKVYRRGNEFCAKIEKAKGFSEEDIPEGEKSCFVRLRRTIHGVFIVQLFLAMAPQGAQALVEARESFNLFWSSMIAADAIFGKMFFLYRLSSKSYDQMALTLYDLKKNGKAKFQNLMSVLFHGTFKLEDVLVLTVGSIVVKFPPGLLFSGLVPMAFDAYTDLVIQDGLTGFYLTLSNNVAQSVAWRWTCGVASFSGNFFSASAVLSYGKGTVYGIIHDGKIAFLKNDPNYFHRARFITSTGAGLGSFAYLSQGFFNFYGLSQAIFGPFLGCAILNATNATLSNATEAINAAISNNASAAFTTYAAPASDVIAGYNVGYMELILFMAAYGFGSKAVKLLWDLGSRDIKPSSLPDHDETVPPEQRFRLIPQLLIHGLSAVISTSIVVFGSYPNVWQTRKAGLNTMNYRATAAGSSAVTEVEGTFGGILAFVEWFVRKVNCCCPGDQRKAAKAAEARVAPLNDDDDDDSSNDRKSCYKNRGCPSFFGWLSRKVRGEPTITEGTALIVRNNSGSEKSFDL